MTGAGMGSDQVFALPAARRLVRYGNQLMHDTGCRARFGGHAAEISPDDPSACMEGAAFLLTYDGDDDGVSPTWCRWHIDEDNASEEGFQDTLGVCFWGETAQGRAYRLVSALYTREAVSAWLRVYRPQYPAGQPPQAAEAEYREALVGAMEVVTQKPWPPDRREVLDTAPLFEDATRSSLDHKSGNDGPLYASNMRLWEPCSPVRRVAALLGGVIGVNDVCIGLARDFPAPAATMLGAYKDEEIAAGRLLVASCVACQGSGVTEPDWKIPQWARGQSQDGSHPSNQSRLCHWMPNQAVLNVLRRGLLAEKTAQGRERFACEQVRTLNCALDCIGHSENIVRVLSRLEHDQRNGSEFLRKRPGLRAIIGSLRALGDLAELADFTQESISDDALCSLLRRLGRRDVDVCTERAEATRVGFKEWKACHRCLCRLVCCVRLLGTMVGVSENNGVTLHGIIVAAVVLKAVKINVRMSDAIIRGGWVRVGTGTSEHLRRAGWVVSRRAEKIGESTHAAIMRQVLPPHCIHETDGESEFENWACEGSRGLSTRLNERKVCSMPGFPRIVTGFTRDAEGQRRAAASGAPLLKYRWEAAVAGYGPADDCSDVFARWTAQGGRSGPIMPRVWHGLN